MKFKNVSEKTKHIMVDGAWAVVNPGDEFEIAKSGSLHLDPDLEKVAETVPKYAPEDATTTENMGKPKPESKPLSKGNASFGKPLESAGKKKEEQLDLNNDGVVDEKDSSIAGKVLANSRKKKGKSKK